MKYLKQFLKPYWKELIIGPAFKLTEAILELMLPVYMAKIIDYGVFYADKGYIIKMGIFMMVLAVVGVLCALVCQYTASKVSQGVGTHMRNAMFEHIGTLSNEVLDQFGTPSLINRITGDINQVQLGVAMLIRLVIRAPFLCIGGIIMAMILDIQLSVVLMIVLPVFGVILGFIMLKTVPLHKNVQSKLDKLALSVRESLTGVRVIRAFAKIKEKEEEFLDINVEYESAAIKVGRISSMLNPLTTFVMNLSIVAVIWFGSIRINTGNIEAGSVIAFINYLTQILAALIIISHLVAIYTKAFASLARIAEVFDAQSTITEPIEELPMENVKDQSRIPVLEFKNVSMIYKGNTEYSLKDISFSVMKGETIGIIGGTGAGKTSLVNMIPRFYDPEEGEVLIDGINIKNIKKDTLIKKIGMVPQKSTLFSGTIIQNIKWGNEHASKEEVITAAEISQASEFIDRLPNHYETMISQGGINVSGGQKQRLSIARALVKKPEILILDDSFNALDFATDRALRTALREKIEDMVCFIISQRISTIKDADKIIVMENGKAVGIGSHSFLLKNCKLYLEICQSQMQEEVTEE